MAYREAELIELENGDVPVKFLQGMGVANSEQAFVVDEYLGSAHGEANAEAFEGYAKRVAAGSVTLGWDELEALCSATMQFIWLSLEVIDYPGRLKVGIIDGHVIEIESNSEEVFERAGMVLATMGLAIRASRRYDQGP